MRLLSNDELMFVGGGVGGEETFNGSVIETQKAEVTGHRQESTFMAEMSCHVISGGIGFSAAIILSETGPLAIMAAEYVVSKIDDACIDYVKNRQN
jgi:hypothetical protein